MKNSEGGIRLSGISGSLDWALSWLYAREDLPTSDSFSILPGVLFQQVIRRILNWQIFQMPPGSLWFSSITVKIFLVLNLNHPAVFRGER
ncbi:hypothetical protein [uncultured Desulfobacter sp.]|uniref:hypothetical protein n=1 Tax=uncultured Desulfobacter sp. TaxID=240139 RepID=UPI0029C73037|nr:hypothetical protein [uncultured Desulfobacter sp.]